MARHVCDNCGAVVSDDHQFCPECGSWIDPTEAGIEDESDGDFEEFSLSGEPPTGPQQSPRTATFPRNEVQCPSCGSPNPATNRHCEECGARLSQGPLPVAPRPAVQATAGVRAAMAIAGLLGIVVIFSLIFNLFGDDEAPDTTDTLATESTTATTAPLPESRPLTVLTENCSITGLASLGCANLTDDGDGEYQIVWDNLTPDDEVTIELILPERSVITGVLWTNIAEDNPRLAQNYRARSITINGGAADVVFELADQGGTQPLTFVAMGTLSVRITIDSAYAPNPVDGQVFSELAIAQIELIGYPQAEAVSSTTTPAETTTTAP